MDSDGSLPVRARSEPRAAAPPTTDIAPDCRHYRGERPCAQNRLCAGCDHYEPFTSRVCIIKFGALGDVVRTLCILPEIRRQFPGAHITWVSLPGGCRTIQYHPMLDRVVPYDAASALMLVQESFDLVISLDKDPQPCSLAMALFAKKKMGIGLSPWGTPVPLNPEARAYFHLGLSDDLKFNVNTKSYPRLIYEALGWRYRGQRYELPVDQAASDRVRLELAGIGWEPRKPTLGINVGAGPGFANKMWPPRRIVDLLQEIRARWDDAVQILLLGGSDHAQTVTRILQLMRAENLADDQVISPGTEHGEQAFIALIDACDVLFSGDTLAMHVAIALNKPTVALFGPTCPQEIDLFDNGEKLIADVPCGPCYKRVCDQGDRCLQAIPIQEAADSIARALGRRHQGGIPLPVLPLPIAA